MYVESLNVGYPQNMAVLDRMLRERSELAHLLGFPNWAAYDTATRMAGNVETDHHRIMPGPPVPSQGDRSPGIGARPA